MKLDTFTRQYLITALWSSLDGEGEPLDANYDIEDLSEEALNSSIEDCKTFQERNWEYILGRESDAGHDFWLTRCGHGCGFFETSDWPEHSKELMKSCSEFGEVYLYVGDDGKLYL